MPDVRVKVNEQIYSINCDPGEEERVKALADYLDGHVQKLTKDVGRIAESRLLMLAALTVCDELFAARELLASGGDDRPALAKMIEDAADRVERLTASLQSRDPSD
ncbi:cell division protein ZapA [Parvularcula sp. LCG005]|uniref:cell division protein ZapA n=1 Tax=Parvularcula sp. LCG005 TaxID=3078805 RepID=UPI0029428547|nr:cell division protein ZapA [Parvularcula sp. LCG005]WOI52827.1 cell division protein ZapA [Parvularcula sp. LCG005]